MGLFRSHRRIKPEPMTGGAGGKASDIVPSPQKGSTGVTFDDFRAEVDACDLGDDWNAARLHRLFEVFDLDGNGLVDQDEFLKAARQLHRLLQALEDAPPKAQASENEAAVEKQHEVAMPPILAAFTPLSKSEQVSAALATLKPLEEALKADGDTAAKLAALATGLESATTVLKDAIDARLGERGIVPLCDAVVATGDDFFVNTYKEIWSGISEKSEIQGVKSCEGDTDRLISLAEKGGDAPGHDAAAHKSWLQKQSARKDALQRHRDIPSLYAAALRARGGFADEVLKSIEANLPGLGSKEEPVKPGPIKSTSRILEKVLLQRDNPGCTDRVCDVVRALVKVRSMTEFSAVLQAIAELHEKGTVIVTRVKDRLRHPSSGGWRDVMINLYVASNEDRHVCEIQVAHKKMLMARVGLDGHAIYGKQRNAIELTERLGVDGKPGRAERTKGLLREALAAGDQLLPTWTRLEAASDASPLPEETRKSAAAVEGDNTWLIPALQALSVESSLESWHRLKAVYQQAYTTCKFSPDGYELPLDQFLKADAVESIDLSSKKLGPRSAAIVAICTLDNTLLKTLNIAENNLTNGGKDMSGVLKIAEALPQSKLTTLNVDGHALLIDELRGTKPTETIDLSAKHLGAASAFIIASCIKGNGVLKELNVDQNNLGVEGGKAFAAVLKDTQITNLSIGGNNLTNGGKDMSGVLKLAEALPQSKLTSLNLANNSLVNAGGWFCDVKGPDCKLTLIDGLQGLQALCDVLPQTKMTHLNIARNALTNNGKDMSGVLQLVEALPQTKLTSLNLQYNELDEAAKQAVKAAAGSGVELTL